MTTEPSEDKPCPFCGAQGELKSTAELDEWWVRCSNCQCTGPTAKTMYDAIKAWSQPSNNMTTERASFEDIKRFSKFAIWALKSRNTNAKLACFLFVSGACLEGMTMSEMARIVRCTRQNISKECVAICDLLSLPIPNGMKSEELRNVHRRRNFSPNLNAKQD